MPRSSHGRVLTQSRRLKAAIGGDSPINLHNNMVPNQSQSHTKNYILCHVRRVMGKANEEEEDEVPAMKQAHSRIPNKINKVITPVHHRQDP